MISLPPSAEQVNAAGVERVGLLYGTSMEQFVFVRIIAATGSVDHSKRTDEQNGTENWPARTCPDMVRENEPTYEPASFDGTAVSVTLPPLAKTPSPASPSFNNIAEARP